MPASRIATDIGNDVTEEGNDINAETVIIERPNNDLSLLVKVDYEVPVSLQWQKLYKHPGSEIICRFPTWITPAAGF